MTGMLVKPGRKIITARSRVDGIARRLVLAMGLAQKLVVLSTSSFPHSLQNTMRRVSFSSKDQRPKPLRLTRVYLKPSTYKNQHP